MKTHVSFLVKDLLVFWTNKLFVYMSVPANLRITRNSGANVTSKAWKDVRNLPI